MGIIDEPAFHWSVREGAATRLTEALCLELSELLTQRGERLASIAQKLRNRNCCAGYLRAAERLTGEKVGIAAEIKP